MDNKSITVQFYNIIQGSMYGIPDQQIMECFYMAMFANGNNVKTGILVG
jgi:hypothetical protein